MPILGANASGAKSSPVAPVIGTATDVGSGRAYNNGAATVTFTAPTSKLPISSYTVTSSPGGFTGTGSSSPITVTGLQSATAYTFTVTATSAAGTSSASSASNSITATTVPQAPTIGSATAGDGSATVTYTAGATGGAAVSVYTATSSPSSITGTGASPITVSPLSNGTAYTFTVTATNANGTSAASSASNSVTPVHTAKGVAITTNSGIYTSTNGTSWTERSYSAGGIDYGNLGWGANYYWALGSSANQLYRSPDAITWTQVANPGFGVSNWPSMKMSISNSGTLVVGTGGSSATVYYTTDGVNWNTANTGISTTNSAISVDYSTVGVGGTSYFLAVGHGITATNYTAAYSATGTTWSVTGGFGSSTASQQYGMFFNAGNTTGKVYMGFAGTNQRKYASDVTGTWTTISTTPNLQGITYFIAAANGATYKQHAWGSGQYWYSTNETAGTYTNVTRTGDRVYCTAKTATNGQPYAYINVGSNSGAANISYGDGATMTDVSLGRTSNGRMIIWA